MEQQELRIKNILVKLNYDLSNVDEKTIVELKEIDNLIVQKQDQINKALQIIKDNQINISNISKVSNLSRKTFYNQKILADYVNYFCTQNKDRRIIAKQKQEISTLKDRIEKMVIRDIEIKNKDSIINELTNEIKALNDKISILESKIQPDFKN